MIDRRWSRTQCRCERKWHLIYVRSVGSAGHRPPIWSHVKRIIISTIRAVYISMTMPRVRLWAISQSLEPNNQLSEHRTWSRPLRNFAQNSLGFFYTWIIRYFTFKGETKCTLIRHSIVCLHCKFFQGAQKHAGPACHQLLEHLMCVEMTKSLHNCLVSLMFSRWVIIRMNT